MYPSLYALQRVCQQELDTLLELIVLLVVLQLLQLLGDASYDQRERSLVAVVASPSFADKEAERLGGEAGYESFLVRASQERRYQVEGRPQIRY